MDEFRFANERLAVAVRASGAELCSLRHERFGEMLWQAQPAWPQYAPNLFPIVGQLVGDRLHHDGKSYPLTRHGFARRRRFAWLEQNADGCRLELSDDPQTRELYPFAFELEIGFRLSAQTLTVSYTIGNPGSQPLPASIGAHPAFRWPLADGVAKAAHTLTFARPEPAPIRRLGDGLLKREAFPTPISGRTLTLSDELFAADAIILDRLASSSVIFTAPGAPAIGVAWNDGFRELGIWSKPGADFLCIEPWHGYASPVDFDGDFAAKPGLLLIPPGGRQTLVMHLSVEPSDAFAAA